MIYAVIWPDQIMQNELLRIIYRWAATPANDGPTASYKSTGKSGQLDLHEKIYVVHRLNRLPIMLYISHPGKKNNCVLFLGGIDRSETFLLAGGYRQINNFYFFYFLNKRLMCGGNEV
jgi:hypothetical protein